ncbi:MAG TPA: LapA family protein [Candidatus Binatia bacterium]
MDFKTTLVFDRHLRSSLRRRADRALFKLFALVRFNASAAVGEVFMYLRTLLILSVLGLIAVFSALNWGAFIAPTALSLGFTSVEAPLGLILLAIVGLLTLLFLIYITYLQSTVLLESRRHGRELQSQRDLAEQAETSRFNQLQTFVETELQKVSGDMEQSKSLLLARLDQIERDLRSALEQTGNSLAAYIGELEDRLDRSLGKPT